MGLRKTFKQGVASVRHYFTKAVPTVWGARYDGDSEGGFGTGGQAVLLPEMVKAQWDDKQIASYLQETTKANYAFGFDAPFNKDTPFVPPTEDPLKEWNYTTRKYVLTQTHAAYQRNPLANTAVEYTADFVIGDGFNLTCKNKEVEKVLEDFICHDDNKLREWERQAVIDLQVDGEIILRYFKGKAEDGENENEIVVVPQRPWELEYIKTERGFYRRPSKYHFQREENEGDDPTSATVTVPEDVPADEILHIAINRHAYELRGRPDLYRILPWLRADTEFLQNRARQNYWRGALLWLVRVLNGSAAQVAQVATRWSRPPTAGSVAIESGNVEVEPLVNPSGANEANEDGRQIKLRSIIGMRMAEYMFADGQNANLASATAQQLPAITRFQAYQTIMIERVWYPLFKLALQSAIDNGILPEQVEEQTSDGQPITDEQMPEMKPQAPDKMTGLPKPMAMQPDKLKPPPPNDPITGEPMPAGTPAPAKMIDTLEAFDVVYNPINQQDLKAMADALNIAVTNEWVSNETASIKMGFDYAIEQKKIDRERVKTQTDIAAGLVPPPPEMIPPEQVGQNAANKPTA